MKIAAPLLAAFAAAAACPAAADDADDRPNVVLIVSDDQGYADLGCFGGDEIRTPHLDRLAAEGVAATSFYVAWPACTPSRGALLTGRYPQRNGLYDMIRNDVTDYGREMDRYEYAVSPEMTLGLDLDEITIADLLKRRGYATGIFGKWDGGRAKRFLPTRRGFDDFHGFANTGIDYWTHERYGVPSMFRGEEPVKEEGFATDLFRREALRFIDEHADEPFFLYVPFNAPHAASSLDKPGVQAKPENVARWYPGRDPEAHRTRYMACVSNMDDAIGAILDRLDERGLSDRTLVLFFSDNGGSGPADDGPLRGRKGQLFEGGVRVPLLARWPGRIPAGTRTVAFLAAMDLFPTIAAASGADLPEGVTLDGADVTPVLAGARPSDREEMFWQRRGDRAARVGRYKWVDSAAGSGLFDLESDLGEASDLSRGEPEILSRIIRRFASWERAMAAAEWRGPFRDE